MAPAPIPFLVYSDGPRLPSGLARIARDLTRRLHAQQDALGISVLQVGFDPLPGPAVPWPLWSAASIDTEGDWGAGLIDQAWWQHFGAQTPEGVLFSIWDPGRSFPLLNCKMPTERWGYFPIDSTNVNDTLAGPARETIERYDRVLAYGRWASEVLGTIRKPIPYLPHGLDLDQWNYRLSQRAAARAEEILQAKPGEIVIGCVATNQRRKDLGLYFATLRELRNRGHKVRGWLHTDRMVREWSVPQLVEDFGLGKKVTVTLTLEDWELAACYALCGCTIAPGLGEGFGYPIVESLACGTPVVHGDFAGGAELVPVNAWRFPMRGERLESVYAMRRPVFHPVDVANAVERALDWRKNDHLACQAYCRGSVEHLGWERIWPRWEAWFKQGLEALRG